MVNRRSFLRCFGAASGAAFMRAQSRPSQPNIVLIYADDVGYGDLSCYGAKRVRTPNLDQIAQNGIRFTHAHSTAATCTPSRFSLLTGEYAWRRSGTGILPGDARLIIKPGTPTWPAVLRSAGYRTGVVGKWHLGLGAESVDWNGQISPGPNEIGFDYSFLIPATGDRVPCVYTENGRVVNLDPADPIRVDYKQPIANEPTGQKNPELLKMHPSHGHDMAIVNGISRIGYMTGGKRALWVDEETADTITGKAAQFIQREKGNPFFLFFATHDVHVPRVPHKRFVGATPMGPRGDVIAELDWSVGEIVKALERAGVADNTILMFTSDNGPVVDDGYKDQAVEKLGDHKPSGPLRGGKYSNFEAGTRVPFVLQWPKQIKRGQTSDALLSQVDFLRSFAKIAGATLPPGAGPDSHDTLDALIGKSMAGRDHIIEQGSSLSVIQGEWKYVEPGKGPAINKNTNTEMGTLPEPQLFNLAQDPGERRNLAEQQPERVKALAALLNKVRSRSI